MIKKNALAEIFVDLIELRHFNYSSVKEIMKAHVKKKKAV